MEELALIVGEWGECAGVVPVLRDAGFEVAQASDYITGLKTLQGEVPGIIVVIEGMESTDEGEWLDEVRHLAPIPIIVVGSGAEDSVVQSLRRGADAYVSKAFSGEGLMSYVRSLMARSEAVGG